MTYINVLPTRTTIEKLKELTQLPNQIKDKIDIQIKPITCQTIDL